MASKAKRSKPCTEDRISELPDEILCHILSLFSTREAVKTSALSKRWKIVWASLSNLDFNEYEFRQGYITLPDRFVQFVNRILFFRDSSNIHKFRLKCSGKLISTSSFDDWICSAIKRNVVELDLSVGDYSPCRSIIANDYYTRPHLELPKSLFTCHTLVSLRLLLDPKVTAVNAPTSNFGFPCLKFLHVTLLYPNPNNSIEKLISCCAALEDLIIDGDIGVYNSYVFELKISAPKVKRLQISLQLDELSSRDIDGLCRTFINADVPNLEELDISYDFLVSYSLRNANFLSKAKVDFKKPGKFTILYPAFSGHVDRVSTLFAEISDVKHLSISTYMLMVLGSNNREFTCWPEIDSIGFQCLPSSFINLKSLELQLKTCYCWNALMNLLSVSPNLEHLAVDNDIICVRYVVVDKHEWHPPEFVPTCLVSHLKTICLRKFQGTPNEMKVAKYLRKHGEVLNDVTVFDLFGKSYKFPKGLGDL